MKTYIAGKITGHENYKADFEKGCKALEEKGFTPVLRPDILPPGLSNDDYMQICFAMIRAAETVAFLPNWKGSKGAKLELAYCKYIGKPIFFMEGIEE